VILTDPLKFWVMIRVRLPANMMGLRYQTSEMAASTTAFIFALLFGVSVVGGVVVAELPITIGVSGSVLVVIIGFGFKSGL